MLRRLSLSMLATLVYACQGEPAPLKAPTAATPAAESSGAGLSCERLLPKEVRDRFMPGTELREASLAARTVMCTASKGGGQMVANVQADCRATTTLAYWQAHAHELTRTHPAYKDLPGLGRAALGTDKELELYDDDTDCLVTVADYEGRPVLELAREVARVLAPGLLPPPEKGKLTLACDRLLPQALRDQLFAGARLTASSLMPDTMKCKLEWDDRPPETVSYNCVRPYPAAFIKEMKAQYDRNKTPADEVTIGSGGVYTAISGAQSVAFVDPELGCLVTLTRMKGDKAAAVETARKVAGAFGAEAAR